MEKQSFYSGLNQQERFLLKSSFFTFFVSGVYAMVFGSLLPYLSAAYQLSDTLSGLLISVHQAGNLIASFIAGILPIYLGRKRANLFLSSFVLLGFVTIIITGQPTLLMIAFFAIGISRGSISNFDNQIVNDVTDSSPAALNLLHGLFAIGALLAPVLVMTAAIVFGDSGWQISCLIILLLAACSQVLLAKVPLEDDFSTPEVNNSRASYLFLKDRYFWITVMILFFYLCVEAAVSSWLVTYLLDAHILSIGQSQLIASLLWLAILVGRLLCGIYGDRLKRSQLLLILTIGTTFFYLLLLSTTSYPVIIAAILGLGAFMGGIYPSALTIAGPSISKYPLALGWLLIIGGLGGIAMPFVTGLLSAHFGIFAGMAAISVVIVLMVIGVILYHRVDKKL